MAAPIRTKNCGFGRGKVGRGAMLDNPASPCVRRSLWPVTATLRGGRSPPAPPFCSAFEMWGLPEAVYTDALSRFGPSSSDCHCDPRSEFQRALRGVDVAHLVAPTPQAKGKIERRFGTFQRRLVTLLSHAKVATWEHAVQVLPMEIAPTLR